MTAVAAAEGSRAIFFDQLHRCFAPGAFDNWVVWAGNLTIQLDGQRFDSVLARGYVGPGKPQVEAKVRVELFVAEVEAIRVRAADVDVRLRIDRPGTPGAGRFLPMNLVCNPSGDPELADGNLVFESPSLQLQETRVHTCTAEFSADSFATGTGEKEWIPLNDIGENRDRVIAVSPDWVAACPPVMEVCVRKVGARCERAYSALYRRLPEWTPIPTGAVHYHRNSFEGGDPEDRVFGYVRYDCESALLMIHNLDHRAARAVTCRFDYLRRRAAPMELLFDSYRAPGLAPEGSALRWSARADGGLEMRVLPLQTAVFRLY